MLLKDFFILDTVLDEDNKGYILSLCPPPVEGTMHEGCAGSASPMDIHKTNRYIDVEKI